MSIEYDIESPEYAAHKKNWIITQDLMGGTPVMREKGEEYLFKNEKEGEKKYRHRLESSTLYNAYRSTSIRLIGQILHDRIMIDDSSTNEFKEWMKNVDRQGNDINMFAKQICYDAYHFGVAHIFTEMPDKSKLEKEYDDAGIPYTMQTDIEHGIKPYLCRVSPMNVLAIRFDTKFGVKEPYYVRTIERNQIEDEENPLVTIEQKVVREFRRGVLVTHTKTGDGQWESKTRNNYKKRIPITTLYFRQDGDGYGRPVAEDQAYDNVKHWQIQSDTENSARFSRFPMLSVIGVDKSEIDQFKVISPDKVYTTSQKDAKIGYIESRGEAISIGEKQLERLERQMDAMGTQLLMPTSGKMTATEAAIKNAGSQATINSLILVLESALNHALGLADTWYTTTINTYKGSITLSLDAQFEESKPDPQLLLALHKLAGELSIFSPEAVAEIIKSLYDWLPEQSAEDIVADAEDTSNDVGMESLPEGEDLDELIDDELDEEED